MTLFTMAIIDAFSSNIWVDFYSATFKKIYFYLEGFPLSFLSPILQGVVSSFFLSSHKKNPPHTYLPNHPDSAPTCAHPPTQPYTPPPPPQSAPPPLGLVELGACSGSVEIHKPVSLSSFSLSTIPLPSPPLPYLPALYPLLLFLIYQPFTLSSYSYSPFCFPMASHESMNAEQYRCPSPPPPTKKSFFKIKVGSPENVGKVRRVCSLSNMQTHTHGSEDPCKNVRANLSRFKTAHARKQYLYMYSITSKTICFTFIVRTCCSSYVKPGSNTNASQWVVTLLL